MVLIDVQVALSMYVKVYHAVLAYLLQHVVEEAQPGCYVAMTVAVEVYLDVDVGFLGSAAYLCGALSAKGYGSHLIPGALTAFWVLGDLQELTADVLGKQTVCLAVSDDVAVGNVVLGIVHVFLHQSGVGFAGRGVVLREVGVDEDVVEHDTFALQRVEYEVMDRPEGIFRKAGGSQAVLV